EPLDREHGVLRVDGGLAAGQLADEPLPRFGEGDDGRCGPPTFGIRNDDRLAGLHDRHHRVRGAQVDAYCLCHCDFSFISAGPGRRSAGASCAVYTLAIWALNESESPVAFLLRG